MDASSSAPVRAVANREARDRRLYEDWERLTAPGAAARTLAAEEGDAPVYLRWMLSTECWLIVLGFGEAQERRRRKWGVSREFELLWDMTQTSATFVTNFWEDFCGAVTRVTRMRRNNLKIRLRKTSCLGGGTAFLPLLLREGPAPDRRRVSVFSADARDSRGLVFYGEADGALVPDPGGGFVREVCAADIPPLRRLELCGARLSEGVAATLRARDVVVTIRSLADLGTDPVWVAGRIPCSFPRVADRLKLRYPVPLACRAPRSWVGYKIPITARDSIALRVWHDEVVVPAGAEYGQLGLSCVLDDELSEQEDPFVLDIFGADVLRAAHRVKLFLTGLSVLRVVSAARVAIAEASAAGIELDLGLKMPLEGAAKGGPVHLPPGTRNVQLVFPRRAAEMGPIRLIRALVPEPGSRPRLEILARSPPSKKDIKEVVAALHASGYDPADWSGIAVLHRR